MYSEDVNIIVPEFPPGQDLDGTSDPVAEGESSSVVKVTTSDDTLVLVNRDIIPMWKTISQMLCDLPDAGISDDEPIPLPKVNSNILHLVIKWCEHHKETAYEEPGEEVLARRAVEGLGVDMRDSDLSDEEEDQGLKEVRYLQHLHLSPWDQGFLDFDGNVGTLLEVIEAANFLDIEYLLNMGCKKVGNMMTNKTPQQIRDTFGITCDYSPDELEKLKNELAWCEGLQLD